MALSYPFCNPRHCVPLPAIMRSIRLHVNVTLWSPFQHLLASRFLCDCILFSLIFNHTLAMHHIMMMNQKGEKKRNQTFRVCRFLLLLLSNRMSDKDKIMSYHMICNQVHYFHFWRYNATQATHKIPPEKHKQCQQFSSCPFIHMLCCSAAQFVKPPIKRCRWL